MSEDWEEEVAVPQAPVEVGYMQMYFVIYANVFREICICKSHHWRSHTNLTRSYNKIHSF